MSLRKRIDPAALARTLAAMRGDIAKAAVPDERTLVRQKPPRPAITYRTARRNLRRGH